MSRALPGLVVLITGASRGIGLALAELLCHHGAQVHACARHIEPLLALRDTFPEQLHLTPCDIRDGEALDRLFAQIASQHGRLDVLVNNASVLGPTTTLAEISDEAWRQTLDINLDGTFFVTRRALPLLQKSDSAPALVLSLSSSVGRKVRANWGAYSISKWAVEGMSQLLTEESDAARLIAVTLNPGGTATPMRAEAYPEEDPDTLPSAEQVARTIALLITRLGPEQAGARYSSRALFDLLDQADALQDAAALPRDP